MPTFSEATTANRGDLDEIQRITYLLQQEKALQNAQGLDIIVDGKPFKLRLRPPDLQALRDIALTRTTQTVDALLAAKGWTRDP